MREAQMSVDILKNADANGVGAKALVGSYRFIIVTLVTAGNAAGTIKFQCSDNDKSNAPDFSAARSTTNRWDYVGVSDLENTGTNVRGDTGVTFAATDDIRYFKVPTDGMQWFCAELSSRTAGTFNVTIRGYQDN